MNTFQDKNPEDLSIKQVSFYRGIFSPKRSAMTFKKAALLKHPWSFTLYLHSPRLSIALGLSGFISKESKLLIQNVHLFIFLADRWLYISEIVIIWLIWDVQMNQGRASESRCLKGNLINSLFLLIEIHIICLILNWSWSLEKFHFLRSSSLVIMVYCPKESKLKGAMSSLKRNNSDGAY